MSVDVKLDARGVWYAQPYLGMTPDGRQIRPRRSFPEAATRAQAQELANLWASQLSADGQVRSTLIVDLLWDYIADREAKGASPYTVKRWRLFTRRYVAVGLRGRAARDITVMEMNAFERRLTLPRERNGFGLSLNTARGVHYFLRGAYNCWFRAHIVDDNPLFYTQRMPEQRHEAVTVDEWDYVSLDRAIGDAMHPETLDAHSEREACYAFAAWLALHTGMRVGEVCAVRRRDLNRRLMYLHVAGKVVEQTGGGLARSDVTKGRRSRNVELSEHEFEVIYGFMRMQASFPGEFTPDSPLVSADGSLMRPSTVSRGFARIRDRCGVSKRCTFHSLRHTHATYLLEHGVNLKKIAERLGHADESTTLRLYAHLLPSGDRDVANAFEEFTDEIGKGV